MLVTDTGALYIYEKTLSGTYIEIGYQSNDGTYYIHKENFIDTATTFALVFLALFTFVSLTIKAFSKGKK